MSSHKIAISMLPILVLGALLLVFYSKPTSLAQNQSKPELESSGDTSSETLMEPDAMPGLLGDLQRENRPTVSTIEVSSQHDLTIVDKYGATISHAIVAWEPASGDNRNSRSVLSEQDGVFRVLSRNVSGWVSVSAEGYWPTRVPLHPESESSLAIRLDLVESYQTFQCIDGYSSAPVAGVKFLVRSLLGAAGRLTGPSSLVSDSSGKIELPFHRSGLLEFEVLKSRMDRFAEFSYRIQSSEESIPVFRKCEAMVLVTRDGGSLGAEPTVGVASQSIHFGKTMSSIAELPGHEVVTNELGKASLELALGVPQTLWARDSNFGYASVVVTPTQPYQDYSIVIRAEPPLVLDVRLPNGIPQSSLSVIATGRNGAKIEVQRADNGFFNLKSPADYQALSIGAEGCQSIRGFLPDPRRRAKGEESSGSGFLRWELELGHEINGAVSWSDGSPAMTSVFLLPTEGPEKISPNEKQGASGWRWVVVPPLVPQETDSDGKFTFNSLPPGVYFLDQIGDSTIPSHQTAVGTFIPSSGFVDVPTTSYMEITLPRLQAVEIEALDHETKAPIAVFTVQRKGEGEGLFGLMGNGKDGFFSGELPVDELGEIEIVAEGYFPQSLEVIDYLKKNELCPVQVTLDQIKSGSFTIQALDRSDLNAGPIRIRISDEGPAGASAQLDARWATTLSCTIGEGIPIQVPTRTGTRLSFTVLGESHHRDFELVPKSVSYFPGQEISVSLRRN